MRTYRIAVVGCGSRGIQQARAAMLHPRIALVGLCDLNAEKRRILGEETGIKARYEHYEHMIREQEPDIVIIATLTKFHAALTEAILNLGCHVDVEKPITLTLDELDRVLAMQRRTGKHIMVHHQAALHPPATKLRELVQQGFIGEPQALRLRNKGYYGGFGILHQGCHALALAISLVGPARAVSAHMVTAGRLTTVDEIYQGPYGFGLVAGEKLTCLYDMENGIYIINEEHLRDGTQSGTIRFEVVGTEGSLALNHAVPTALYHSSKPHWHPTDPAWSEVLLTPEERTIAGLDFTDKAINRMDIWLLEEWVQALDQGRAPKIDAVVGANTMEMTHGAYASHAEGRRISLPQAERSHPLERWLKREGRPLPPAGPEIYKDWLPWAMNQARGQQ